MRYALILTLALVSCTPSKDKFMRALKSAGYTEVKLQDPTWLNHCGPYEAKANFSAMNGKVPVQGIVCCGHIKPCTIRYE